jgi:hypothetical protein
MCLRKNRKSASEIMREALGHLSESKRLIRLATQLNGDAGREASRSAAVVTTIRASVLEAARLQDVPAAGTPSLELAEVNNGLAQAWAGTSAQHCLDAQADCHHFGTFMFGATPAPPAPEKEPARIAGARVPVLRASR